MAGQANRRPPESGRTNTSTIVLLVPLVFSAVVGVLWAIALGSHLRRSPRGLPHPIRDRRDTDQLLGDNARSLRLQKSQGIRRDRLRRALSDMP